MAEETKEATPELFGLVKTLLIKEFEWNYGIIMQVVVFVAPITIANVGCQGGGMMSY